MDELEVTLKNGQEATINPDTGTVTFKPTTLKELSRRLKEETKKQSLNKTYKGKFTADDVRGMIALKERNPKKTLDELEALAGYKWSKSAISRANNGKYDGILEAEKEDSLRFPSITTEF